MRIQVDFDNKIIKLENSTNLLNFIEKIKLILGEELKDYKLDTNTKIEWINPMIVKTDPYWYYKQPYVYYTSNNNELTNSLGNSAELKKTGIINIQYNESTTT